MNKTGPAVPRSYIPDIGFTVVKPRPEGAAKRFIDLSLNESSYGPSPRALEATLERCQSLNRYPDPESTDLREAIGRAYGLPPEQITCGNGSEEVLDAIGRIYARPGDEILFGEYAFMQFPIVAMRVGATPVKIPEKNFNFSAGDVLAAVTGRTKIIFLANPNNPSGTYMPADDLRRLRDELPSQVVLVIDSAYSEYATADDYTVGMELVEGTENVVVTRTFSKAFGLAALRVGWSYAPLSMTGVLNRMRGIGNVNALAQDAAVAALGDLDFVARVRDNTVAQREIVARELKALGIEPVPGQVNFVLGRFPSETNHTASAAHAHLAQEGIIVRGVEDYGLGDYLRFTLGLAEENQAMLEALRKFML